MSCKKKRSNFLLLITLIWKIGSDSLVDIIEIRGGSIGAS